MRYEHINGEIVYINLKKVIGYRVETCPHRISVDMEDGNTYYIQGNFKCTEDMDAVIQRIIAQSHYPSNYVIEVPSVDEARMWFEETCKHRR